MNSTIIIGDYFIRADAIKFHYLKFVKKELP